MKQNDILENEYLVKQEHKKRNEVEDIQPHYFSI
jgi:hypothetical protein